MLDDNDTIDQIVVRREALASAEAAEAADLLAYVDRAREVGELRYGEAHGRRRVDAAMHELSLAMKLPVPTVERQIARARRLRTLLPTVRQAWHDGRISTAGVEAIDRVARRLTHPDSTAHLDDIAVDKISKLTPGQATRWLDRWVERTEASAVAACHQLADADRNVALRPAGDGMTRITALLPSVEAAAIMQRLTTAGHALQADDDRTIDQSRADLFADALLERQPGGLGHRAIIRAAMADEQSLLYRLVTDDIGNLTTVTWLGGFAPTRLKQVLEFRDGTSVFPTSSVPASMCDNDHNEPWPAETCAANTGSLNRRVHNLKTEGFIILRQPLPGTFEWTTSTGHS